MALKIPLGAGEFGESEYGEKADESMLEGEGMSGLFNAMASSQRKVVELLEMQPCERPLNPRELCQNHA